MLSPEASSEPKKTGAWGEVLNCSIEDSHIAEPQSLVNPSNVAIREALTSDMPSPEALSEPMKTRAWGGENDKVFVCKSSLKLLRNVGYDVCVAYNAPEGGVARQLVASHAANFAARTGVPDGMTAVHGNVAATAPDFDEGTVEANGIPEGKKLSLEKHFIRSIHLPFLQRPTPQIEIKLLLFAPPQQLPAGDSLMRKATLRAVSSYRGYPLRLDSGSRAAKADPNAIDSEHSSV
nr:hypothetical protein Iba_chr03cCG5340 [Ipomoea batatas]